MFDLSSLDLFTLEHVLDRFMICKRDGNSVESIEGELKELVNRLKILKAEQSDPKG